MAELRGGTTIDGYIALHKGNAIDSLETIKTVDGPGSGLESDLLDGYHGQDFALANHTHITNDIIGVYSTDAVTINGIMYTVGPDAPIRISSMDVWIFDPTLPSISQANKTGLAMIDAQTINGIRITTSSDEPTIKNTRDIWIAI